MDDADEWCLIESDPGVFTELISNMGVSGVQVEEIWSLDYDFSSLDTVYGIIFLFKWDQESAKSQNQNPQHNQENQEDSNGFGIEDPIFIRQIITNSCATQAIISVLLNNHDISLGSELTNFKDFILPLTPELRGMVLANSEVIRSAHNSFAKQNIIPNDPQLNAGEPEDAFHFVAYVNKDSATFKLDGLASAPAQVGANSTPGNQNSWITAALNDIKSKIESAGSSEIRFNLMAITKDCRIAYQQRLDQIATDIKQLQDRLQNLKISSNSSGSDSYPDNSATNADESRVEHDASDIKSNIEILLHEKYEIQSHLDAHNKKLRDYHNENSRRKHNFIPMIYTLIEALARSGKLDSAISRAANKKQKTKNKQ